MSHYKFILLIFSMLLPSLAWSQETFFQHQSIPAINSPYHEEAVVFHPSQQKLYFTIKFHPENVGRRKDLGDIWQSQLTESGEWSSPVRVEHGWNDTGKNAVLWVSADGKRVYLRNIYQEKGDPKPGISVSEWSGGQWSKPQALTIPYFTNRSEHLGMSMSQDERIMILAIQSFASKGAEDLYVSFLKADGTWTEPKNMGAVLNTPFEEYSPWLAPDGETLYFSSNGHGGFGSKDVFVSKRLDNTWFNWSEPVNLGSKVNTEGMETFFSISAQKDFAYLISTQNSDGYADVKRIPVKALPEEVAEEVMVKNEIPQPEVRIVLTTPKVVSEKEQEAEEIPIEVQEPNTSQLQGIVMNTETRQAVSATVTIRYRSGNLPSISLQTDSLLGKFQTKISLEERPVISISARGYLPQEEVLDQNSSDGPFLNKNYYLESVEVGKTITLKNVLFERANANLLEESSIELDNVVQMMLDNPEMEIFLSGHTDNQGNSKLNLELSQDRVEAVKNYLVSKGISEERIDGKGFGGTKPIASNKSEQSRQLNRRVEFTIIKN